MTTLLNLARAGQILDEEHVDVVVATTHPNVYYLSGFRSFSQRFLPSTQVYAISAADALSQPTVVAPMADADMFAQFPLPHATMMFYGRFFVDPPSNGNYLSEEMRRFEAVALQEPGGTALDMLISELDKLPRSTRIALDERGIASAAHDSLRERYNGRIVPGNALIERIRMVKTPEEIRRLTRAVDAIEAAYEVALSAAREGMTEEAMARIFDTHTIELGCSPTFTVIAFGERSALPNAVPGNRELHSGDIIRFDIGCQAAGYYSDIARTAIFGTPTERQQAYYGAILAGESRGLEALRAGVPAKAVFEAAILGTQQEGIPHYRRHHVGHGIGLDVYDPPTMNDASQVLLEPGMVLEVETPYYEIGFGGLQVEDTVVVTETGYRMLTRTPRELQMIG